MGWTPQAQLTKSATRASANSTESTAVSSASLPCAMSKLFGRTVLSPHDLMAGATGLEPAASCVTGRRSNQLNYAPHTTSSDAADSLSFLPVPFGRAVTGQRPPPRLRSIKLGHPLRGTHKKMNGSAEQELREFIRLKRHSHELKNQQLGQSSLFRDQGVGGSNPLSPTILLKIK